METLTAIRRAGADIILTYWATEAARRLALAGRYWHSRMQQSPGKLRSGAVAQPLRGCWRAALNCRAASVMSMRAGLERN